jgi:hypothetical protein
MDQGEAAQGAAAPVDVDEGEDSGAEVDTEDEDENGSEEGDDDNLPSSDEDPTLPDTEVEPGDEQSENDHVTSNDDENENEDQTIDESIAGEEHPIQEEEQELDAINGRCNLRPNRDRTTTIGSHTAWTTQVTYRATKHNFSNEQRRNMRRCHYVTQ